MRVYGGNFFLNGVQVRGIIAGTQKQVAAETSCSLSFIREYWTQTGNTEEIAIATASPGVLFWCSINDYSKNRIYTRAAM